MDIAEAIRSIPEKKRNLQNALAVLNSTTILASTPILQWEDLDSHFSSIIDYSIHRQPNPNPNPNPQQPKHPDRTLALTPATLKLRSLCSEMDAAGIASHITSPLNLVGLRTSLHHSLPAAADPFLLVLDVVRRLLRPSHPDERRALTCTVVLDKLDAVGAEISPAVRASAGKLACEWKGGVRGKGGGSIAMALLQLVASYRLAGEVDVGDDTLQACLMSAWKRHRKRAMHLVQGLGLRDRLPEVIQKLSKGRKLVAVKFIYAFKLEDEFPPVPLLKAYLDDIKKATRAVQKKRDYSTESQRDAVKNEFQALRSVLKIIRHHKLEIEYPPVALEKRMAELKYYGEGKKRGATDAASSNSKNQKQQEQPPEPTRSLAATTETVISAHSNFSLVQSCTPYAGVMASGSVHKHADPCHTRTGMDHSPSLMAVHEWEEKPVAYKPSRPLSTTDPLISAHPYSSLVQSHNPGTGVMASGSVHKHADQCLSSTGMDHGHTYGRPKSSLYLMSSLECEKPMACKLSRPLSTTQEPVISADPYFSFVQSHTPHIGAMASSSVHNHVDSLLSSPGMDHGQTYSLPSSSLYSVSSLECEKPDAYSGNPYQLSGLPPHYGSSGYP